MIGQVFYGHGKSNFSTLYQHGIANKRVINRPLFNVSSPLSPLLSRWPVVIDWICPRTLSPTSPGDIELNLSFNPFIDSAAMELTLFPRSARESVGVPVELTWLTGSSVRSLFAFAVEPFVVLFPLSEFVFIVETIEVRMIEQEEPWSWSWSRCMELNGGELVVPVGLMMSAGRWCHHGSLMCITIYACTSHVLSVLIRVWLLFLLWQE